MSSKSWNSKRCGFWVVCVVLWCFWQLSLIHDHENRYFGQNSDLFAKHFDLVSFGRTNRLEKQISYWWNWLENEGRYLYHHSLITIVQFDTHALDDSVPFELDTCAPAHCLLYQELVDEILAQTTATTLHLFDDDSFDKRQSDTRANETKEEKLQRVRRKTEALDEFLNSGFVNITSAAQSFGFVNRVVWVYPNHWEDYSEKVVFDVHFADFLQFVRHNVFFVKGRDKYMLHPTHLPERILKDEQSMDFIREKVLSNSIPLVTESLDSHSHLRVDVYVIPLRELSHVLNATDEDVHRSDDWNNGRFDCGEQRAAENAGMCPTKVILDIDLDFFACQSPAHSLMEHFGFDEQIVARLNDVLSHSQYLPKHMDRFHIDALLTAMHLISSKHPDTVHFLSDDSVDQFASEKPSTDDGADAGAHEFAHATTNEEIVPIAEKREREFAGTNQSAEQSDEENALPKVVRIEEMLQIIVDELGLIFWTQSGFTVHELQQLLHFLFRLQLEFSHLGSFHMNSLSEFLWLHSELDNLLVEANTQLERENGAFVNPYKMLPYVSEETRSGRYPVDSESVGDLRALRRQWHLRLFESLELQHLLSDNNVNTDVNSSASVTVNGDLRETNISTESAKKRSSNKRVLAQVSADGSSEMVEESETDIKSEETSNEKSDNTTLRSLWAKVKPVVFRRTLNAKRTMGDVWKDMNESNDAFHELAQLHKVTLADIQDILDDFKQTQIDSRNDLLYLRVSAKVNGSVTDDSRQDAADRRKRRLRVAHKALAALLQKGHAHKISPEAIDEFALRSNCSQPLNHSALVAHIAKRELKLLNPGLSDFHDTLHKFANQHSAADDRDDSERRLLHYGEMFGLLKVNPTEWLFRGWHTLLESNATGKHAQMDSEWMHRYNGSGKYVPYHLLEGTFEEAEMRNAKQKEAETQQLTTEDLPKIANWRRLDPVQKHFLRRANHTALSTVIGFLSAKQRRFLDWLIFCHFYGDVCADGHTPLDLTGEQSLYGELDLADLKQLPRFEFERKMGSALRLGITELTTDDGFIAARQSEKRVLKSTAEMRLQFEAIMEFVKSPNIEVIGGGVEVSRAHVPVKVRHWIECVFLRMLQRTLWQFKRTFFRLRTFAGDTKAMHPQCIDRMFYALDEEDIAEDHFSDAFSDGTEYVKND